MKIENVTIQKDVAFTEEEIRAIQIVSEIADQLADLNIATEEIGGNMTVQNPMRKDSEWNWKGSNFETLAAILDDFQWLMEGKKIRLNF